MRFSALRPMKGLIVHADDFGIGPAQSRRILECARHGALNSLSVLVTSPAYRECARLLHGFEGDLLVGLHVNLVEGKCAAAPSDVPLLADADGTFRRGFGGLLAASLRHPREMRGQVACEVGAQMGLFFDEFPDSFERLRLDSHQHFHMIPAVFDGMVQAVERSGCAVEYIRVPAEPLAPFARSRALHLAPPVNWVKHVVLNVLWQANKRKVAGLAQHTAVFCGINFSGCMTAGRVRRVLGALETHAARKGRPLELLFHPGGVDRAEDCLNPSLPGFVAFYLSPNRAAEADALTSGVLDAR